MSAEKNKGKSLPAVGARKKLPKIRNTHAPVEQIKANSSPAASRSDKFGRKRETVIHTIFQPISHGLWDTTRRTMCVVPSYKICCLKARSTLIFCSFFINRQHHFHFACCIRSISVYDFITVLVLLMCPAHSDEWANHSRLERLHIATGDIGRGVSKAPIPSRQGDKQVR